MSDPQRNHIQVWLSIVVATFVLGLLCWQHFTSGVPSHHLLHRSDLPAISNWWGALLLPGLTWFSSALVFKRESGRYPLAAQVGFLAALFYGIVLSIAFTNGLDQVASLMGPALLVIALFLPIYRPEYLLGFVLGMSYTFGAVLPTGFGLIVCVLAFLIYKLIRTIPVLLVRKLSKTN
ncbi:hypothetical protein [Pelagicoccus mobilis]|uniref:Uncharacterized protein n=1 Tax=Pelagicoccus mobilis TaxID=415221 RepID=A0A934S0X6_9BACT|nr:hypothetical protein [Pelagicoccus mobilis]MBK1877083.1 hypothetical protein [Pelagicoccus mobilis]